MMNIQYRQNGQSLLEVLVALGAIIVILGAITSIVLSSLKQSGSSSRLTQATQYAQEGMELVKVTSSLLAGGVYCLNESNQFQPDSVCSNQTNIGSVFRRRVIMGTSVDNTRDCSGLQKVTVSVSWTDSQCGNTPFCHEVPLNSCL